MITSLYSHLLCRMFYSGGMKPYYSTAESSVGFPQKCPSAPHHASLYYLLSQITAALNSVSEITHSRRRIRSRKKPNGTTLIFPSSFFQTTFCFSPFPNTWPLPPLGRYYCLWHKLYLKQPQKHILSLDKLIKTTKSHFSTSVHLRKLHICCFHSILCTNLMSSTKDICSSSLA